MDIGIPLRNIEYTTEGLFFLNIGYYTNPRVRNAFGISPGTGRYDLPNIPDLCMAVIPGTKVRFGCMLLRSNKRWSTQTPRIIGQWDYVMVKLYLQNPRTRRMCWFSIATLPAALIGWRLTRTEVLAPNERLALP